MASYTYIGPISQLISMQKLPVKGALKDEELDIIHNAGILIQDNYIHSVGPHEAIKEVAAEMNAEIIPIEGSYVCLPGFIDAHTHICFGGSRANDYAMRNAGKSYLEIAKAGGGIWDTVTQTRKSSPQELEQGIIHRTQRLLQTGVTTAEVKSGYGLSIEEELKMLRAIKNAASKTTIDLIGTCLAAHMLPKDYEGTHTEYLQEISTTLFPILREEGLANRIDAFIEQSAFSADHIHEYFSTAREMGFDITVHADQFTPGGSKVAIDFNAISADHLEASTEEEIKHLANSEVIAVALPGASIGLGCAFTPARAILDAGGALAIASDWNPGSAPMGDLLTQATILGTFQKLSNTEVLAGITFRAAAALNVSDRGRLQEGFLADFCLFPTDNYNEICYHQGKLTPDMVWKNGAQILTKK